MVTLGAVAMMLVLSRQHLIEQWHAQPESTEGLVRSGQVAGQTLSLDNLEDSLIGLYLRVQQPVLASPAGASSQPVPFTIELGETATSVAERLQEMGLISDAGLFRLYMRYNGIDQQLEAGDFELAYTMAMPEIAQALQNALVREVTVTVPEGWRAEQVAEYLQEEGIMDSESFMAAVRLGDPVALGMGSYDFLRARPAGASLEGYLFPDTYRIPARAKATDLLSAMLDNFEEKVPQELQVAASSTGLSLGEVVTLASIVEREAVQADERPLIASVYRNRLSGFCAPEVGGPTCRPTPLCSTRAAGRAIGGGSRNRSRSISSSIVPTTPTSTLACRLAPLPARACRRWRLQCGQPTRSIVSSSLPARTAATSSPAPTPSTRPTWPSTAGSRIDQKRHVFRDMSFLLPLGPIGSAARNWAQSLPCLPRHVFSFAIRAYRLSSEELGAIAAMSSETCLFFCH